VAFLEQLRRAYPTEPLIVVLDHGGDPTSRRAWARWYRWPQPSCPCFLPAYTPELHRRARVWRWLKEQRSGHRWWADWQTLRTTTQGLLAHLRARFHRQDGPAIEIVHDFCSTA
jgi:hypothetical protein